MDCCGAAVWHDAAIARWIRRCCGGWCDYQPLIDFLQHTGKPTDTEIYNKQTPFFSIFLEGCSSEHYGTELHITAPPEQIDGLPQLLRQLSVLDAVEMGILEIE